MRTLNRLVSMAVGASIASATPAHAAPAKYWVLIATRNADISVQEKVEVFDRTWACGYMPKMDLSEKFPAFVSGYQAFVVGPYEVRQDADLALGKLRPCFGDARVKFTEYRSEQTDVEQEKKGASSEYGKCLGRAIRVFYTQSEPATVVANAALEACRTESERSRKAWGFTDEQQNNVEDGLRSNLIARVMSYRAAAKLSEQTTTAPAKKEYIQ